MDGDHTIERCYEVTAHTLVAVFAALRRHQVRLDGLLLKPNMVLPGQDSVVQADAQEVAAASVACLREWVQAAVPGAVFRSGGQSDKAAPVQSCRAAATNRHHCRRLTEEQPRPPRPFRSTGPNGTCGRAGSPCPRPLLCP
jgi:fructose-bisphosphate aldolase class I